MAVNLSPVGGVAAQFFDNSGNVLTGGLLYTYAAGTTTPAVTYTTSLGVTAQPNPIVLDAAGRVPNSGEIWLTDGVSYKFVLKDSNNVQIATWDNIVGINSNFINYSLQTDVQTATQGQTVFTLVGINYQPATNSLSVFVNGSRQIITDNYIETSSTVVTFVDGLNVGDVVEFITATSATGNATTAANVSYNEGNTGAIDRNVEQKLQEFISVLDFGADPTGVTDSTLAIQAAMDALSANGTDVSFTLPRPGGGTNGFNVKSNGQVYFPEGSYLVSDSIDIPAYCIVKGDHATITGSDSTKPIFNVYGFEVHIEGFSFAKGKEAINYTHGNIDTSIASVTNCTFNANNGYSINTTGCYSTKFNVWNCKFISTNGVIFDECDETTIRDCWVTALKPSIAYFVNNSGNMSIYDIVGVPDIGDTSTATTTYWIQNGNSVTKVGGYIVAEKFRFGAEAGGIAIARNYAKAATAGQIYSGLIFKDCGMWAGNSIIRCEETPNFVITRDSDLFPGGTPRVTFDESASAMLETPFIELDIYQTAEDSEPIPPSGEYIYGIESQSGLNVLNTNSVFSTATTASALGTGGSTTTTSQDGIYPPLIQTVFGSLGALPQLYQTFNYTKSITAGWHSLSVLIKANKDILITLSLSAGQGATKTFHVPGDNEFHVVTFPALVVGTSTNFNFAIYFAQENTTIQWGCPKVTQGHQTLTPTFYIGSNAPNPYVQSVNGQLYSSGIPTVGSWNVGTTIYNSAPTSGGHIGWVCTATGSPGTWKTFGAIAA